MQRERGADHQTGAVALILMLATMVGLEGVAAYSPGLGQALGREDGIVEWATVWAFLLAAAVWLAYGLRRRRFGFVQALFPLGMALFWKHLFFEVSSRD